MNATELALPGKKDSRLFSCIAYLYVAVPFLIFMMGWFRLPLAIGGTAILLIGLFFAMKDAPKTDVSLFQRANLPGLFGAVLLAFLWVYLSGIGGFAYQNYDHMWRNAVLKTLVEQDWPVILPDATPYFENPVALVYYFAFWLPAALVGKSFGLGAAHNFLFLWTVIGVLLVFYFISAFRKRLSVPVLLAFIFFSGLDIVGSFLLTNSSNFVWFSTSHLENWAYGFQISSLTTQLFWVFNQALPAWLITLLLLHQKDNRSIVFLFSFSLMFSALPAVGMIPILLYLMLRRCVTMYDKGKSFLKNLLAVAIDTFTVQNVIAGGFVGITSFLFLRVNATGTGGAELIEIKPLLMSYLLSIFFEFLVYYIAIYRVQKRSGLFYLSLGVLLAVPFIKVGPHVDFVMRASIPALMVLFVLVIDAIYAYMKQNRRIAAAVVCLLLVLGSFTGIHEMMRSVNATVDAGKTEEFRVTAEEIDLLENGMRNNFFGEYEDSFFFRYIARRD